MIPEVRTDSQAQSPDELFDVIAYDGTPTGIVKRRADVHRDGDWHAAIHVWVVRSIGGRNTVLFQQRSLAKDTFGGKLDATVGGHLNTGETWRNAVRETEEEIGVAYLPDDLIPAGRRTAVGEGQPGYSDREVQFVFFAHDERALASFTPNPVELAALVEFEVEGLCELFAGNIGTINGTVRSARDRSIYTQSFAVGDFASIMDRYYYRVAIAARLYLSGEQHFSI